MGKSNNNCFYDIFVAYSAPLFKLRLNTNLGFFSVSTKSHKRVLIDQCLCYMLAPGGSSKKKIRSLTISEKNLHTEDLS